MGSVSVLGKDAEMSEKELSSTNTPLPLIINIQQLKQIHASLLH